MRQYVQAQERIITMTDKEALSLMQDAMTGLRRSGMIKQDIPVDGNTVLLGKGSLLDSIAFVTFISDLEDLVSDWTGKELFLVLNEMHEFNADRPCLLADALAQYLLKLSNDA